MLQIHQFPSRQDNYGFLIHDAEHGITATIDTPEITSIEQALADTGWTLTHILNTHHHYDHVEANLQLKAKYGCTIIGPRNEADLIPGIDLEVNEGDTVEFGRFKARVYDTPGHTLGHIVYRFVEQEIAFIGDVIFPMGCGRLFEGTASQGWLSIRKIMSWPPQTQLYCAHEYAQANAQFALSVEPNNPDLAKRIEEVAAIRQQGGFTVPTTIAKELKTNPFVRLNSKEIRRSLSLEVSRPVDVFAVLRQRKDNF